MLFGQDDQKCVYSKNVYWKIVQWAFKQCLGVRTRGKVSRVDINLTNKARSILLRDKDLCVKATAFWKNSISLVLSRDKQSTVYQRRLQRISYYLLLTSSGNRRHSRSWLVLEIFRKASFEAVIFPQLYIKQTLSLFLRDVFTIFLIIEVFQV